MLNGVQFAVQCRLYRAASLMAENYKKRSVQVSARILHAAHDLRGNDVARNANDEQFTEIGVKYQFRWNAGITASEYGRVRLLTSGQVRESLLADSGKARSALKKPFGCPR